MALSVMGSWQMLVHMLFWYCNVCGVRAENCVRCRCSIFVTRDMFAVFVSIVYEWFSYCNEMCVIDV